MKITNITTGVKSKDKESKLVYKYTNREISYTNTGNVVIRFWIEPKPICKHCGLPVEELKAYTGEMMWFHKAKPIEHGTISGNRYCKMMTDDPLPDGVPMSKLQVAEPEEKKESQLVFDEKESDDLINFIQCDINKA